MVFFSNGPLHATLGEMLLRVVLVPLGMVLVTVAFFPLPMWASDLHGGPRAMISMGMHQGNPNYLTIITPMAGRLRMSSVSECSGFCGP